MFMLFYLMIMSFTYLLVHSEGETTCDCSELGVLKSMVQELLYENKKVTTRLRKLEDGQSTASHSKTATVSYDRLEKLEHKVEDLEIKFNNTITVKKQKQEVIGRNIGAIVKKTLNLEKKERIKFVSSMHKTFIEHNKSLETFKNAMNHTIDERFEYINAIQNEHSHDIKETLAVFENSTADAFSNVLNNISTFQEDIIVDVNRRLDGIKQVNESVSETRDQIRALGKLVEVDNEWSLWSEWGECQVSCGIDGIRERIRACASKFGCIGNSKDFSSCTTRSCFVRLVNGSNGYEGRLEVLHNGVWGTVCDDDFDVNAARVTCKMLNFPSAAPVVYQKAHFGRGSLPILLDNVGCGGTESSIFSCYHRPWGEHNCKHSEDVGILCSSGSPTGYPAWKARWSLEKIGSLGLTDHR